MIIYLTKTIGRTVAVNFNMVTYVEEYSDHSEVHFAYSCITVKESFDEIRRKVFYGKK
jgi:hypothetical protein